MAGFAVDTGAAAGELIGVIMYDGVSLNGTLSGALESLENADADLSDRRAAADVELVRSDHR